MQRSFGWASLAAVAVVAAVVCSSAVQASQSGSTISIKFAADEPTGTAGSALAATDVAGAANYATANWVNEMTASGVDSNMMRDDFGVASPASGSSLTWAADGTWATEAKGEWGNAFPSGPDETLMTGYLDAGFGVGFTDIEITGLPADFASGFSVVIYSLGGVLGRPMALYVNDPNQVAPIFVVPGGDGGLTNYKHGMNGKYVQVIGDDPTFGADDYGNYAVFTQDGNGKPLTGTSVSIQAYPMTFRGVINAIQIVKNP